MIMIKRLLFILVACALNFTLVLRAQTLSEKEFIEECMLGKEKCEAFEKQMMVDYGLKVELSNYYDSDSRSFVYSYKWFSSDVFNAIDIEVEKEGVIKGMLSGILGVDPSGESLETLVNEYKKHNINIRIEYRYEKKVKSATITPTEIQRLASLLY